MRKYSLGIFDSGLGGLSVFKEIAKKMPEYNYIYLGDSARCPYGNRSQELIFQFTREGVDFLFKQNCSLVVLACNTASSESLRRIQQEWLPKYYPQRRVLGVIIPSCEEAAQKTKNKRMGIMATKGTVDSLAFQRELGKIDKKIKVFQQACPLLVPLIEAGEHKSVMAEAALKQYLAPLLDKGIDTLILGCTHYGLLNKQIRDMARVKVISQGKIIAEKLKDYLKRHPEIEQQMAKQAQTKFFTTDIASSFEKLGPLFFGKPLKAERIDL